MGEHENMDPSAHDQEFNIKFLEFLGQQGALALQLTFGEFNAVEADDGYGGGGGNYGGRGRQGNDSWGGGGGGYGNNNYGSSGDSQKDQLIWKIKQYQRQGDEQKNQWWTYCNEFQNGLRDPMKHSTESLKE